MNPTKKERNCRIVRTSESGLEIASLVHPTHVEHYITAVPRAGRSLDEQQRAVRQFVTEQAADLFAMTVFATPGESGERIHETDEMSCPITWLEAADESTSGVQALAVTDSMLRAVVYKDSLIGGAYEAGGVRYCRLGGALRDPVEWPRDAQTRAAFDLWAEGLLIAGMTYQRVVRTWFHNEDSLSRYDEFNRVRDECFTERGVFQGVTPASTGVGVLNPFGAALSGELLAIDGEGVVVRAVPSPLQCAALDYGSSFNRAIEVATPGFRRLMISGTAGIDADGETMHVGDVGMQIARTMEVVEAILDSRDMGWADATRAIAYFKHAADIPVFQAYCEKHALPPLPALLVRADICRADLLFELELDATVAPRSRT